MRSRHSVEGKCFPTFILNNLKKNIFQNSGRTRTHITKRWRNVSLRFQMLSMFGSDATTKKHPSASTKSAEKAKNLFVFSVNFFSKNTKIKLLLCSHFQLPSAFYTTEESCLNELYVSLQLTRLIFNKQMFCFQYKPVGSTLLPPEPRRWIDIPRHVPLRNHCCL